MLDAMGPQGGASKQEQTQEGEEEEEQQPQLATGGCGADNYDDPPGVQLIWSPDVIAHVDQDELELYLQFAASSCVPGGGCNVEEALDVLFQARGDLKEAMQRLLKLTTNTHKLWTLEEVVDFERAQRQHGKDFALISKDLKTKTVKECLHFYYTWKKSNFRNCYLSPTRVKPTGSMTSVTSSNSSSCTSTSTLATTNSTSLSASQKHLTGTPSSSTSDESRDSGRGESLLDMDEFLALPNQQPAVEFPCKVCGRIFDRIKSRSAHMKRHKNEAYKR